MLDLPHWETSLSPQQAVTLYHTWMKHPMVERRLDTFELRPEGGNDQEITLDLNFDHKEIDILFPSPQKDRAANGSRVAHLPLMLVPESAVYEITACLDDETPVHVLRSRRRRHIMAHIITGCYLDILNPARHETWLKSRKKIHFSSLEKEDCARVHELAQRIAGISADNSDTPSIPPHEERLQAQSDLLELLDAALHKSEAAQPGDYPPFEAMERHIKQLARMTQLLSSFERSSLLVFEVEIPSISRTCRLTVRFEDLQFYPYTQRWYRKDPTVDMTGFKVHFPASPPPASIRELRPTGFPLLLRHQQIKRLAKTWNMMIGHSLRRLFQSCGIMSTRMRIGIHSLGPKNDTNHIRFKLPQGLTVDDVTVLSRNQFIPDIYPRHNALFAFNNPSIVKTQLAGDVGHIYKRRLPYGRYWALIKLDPRRTPFLSPALGTTSTLSLVLAATLAMGNSLGIEAAAGLAAILTVFPTISGLAIAHREEHIAMRRALNMGRFLLSTCIAASILAGTSLIARSLNTIPHRLSFTIIAAATALSVGTTALFTFQWTRIEMVRKLYHKKREIIVRIDRGFDSPKDIDSRIMRLIHYRRIIHIAIAAFFLGAAMILLGCYLLSAYPCWAATTSPQFPNCEPSHQHSTPSSQQLVPAIP